VRRASLSRARDPRADSEAGEHDGSDEGEEPEPRLRGLPARAQPGSFLGHTNGFQRSARLV
jgi:hypothetical protein